MFKTKDLLQHRRVCAVLVMLAGVPMIKAQTIEEIAEAQRAKVQLELAIARSAKDPVKAPAVEPVKRMVQKSPPITLHAVYSNGSGFVAEVTDGSRLAVLAVGMRHANAVVSRVDEKGVHLTALSGCKVLCPQERVITIGGTF